MIYPPKKIGSAADLISGYAFKSKDFGSEGIPIIKIKNIVPPSVDLSSCSYYAGSKSIDSKYLVDYDDILISLTGSTVNQMSSAVGKVGKFRYKESALLNQRVGKFIVTDKSALSKEFLYHWISQPSVQYLLANIATGSANQANISPSQIRDVTMPMPEIDIQQRIAEILGALDDKIELNLQMNKTLEEMAMLLYKHWFANGTEELTKTLSEYVILNPSLRIKKGTIAKFVEMKLLQDNRSSISGFAFKKFSGGSKFQNEDTLLARITPCLENGKTAFVDILEEEEVAAGSTEFLVMRSKEGVSPYWVYCTARYPSFRNHAISSMVGTSGRQRVQNDPLLNYKLPEIDFDLQRAFHERVDPYFKLIHSNSEETNSLSALRDLLLPKLISGEIRVKDAQQKVKEVL